MCISKSNTIKGEQINFHIMEEKFRLMYGSLYDRYLHCETFYWSVLKNSFCFNFKMCEYPKAKLTI